MTVPPSLWKWLAGLFVLLVIVAAVLLLRLSRDPATPRSLTCPSSQGKVCFGQGRCQNGACVCNPGWHGVACDSNVQGCPSGVPPGSNVAKVCGGNGTCNTNGNCNCNVGWTGATCTQPVNICPLGNDGTPCSGYMCSSDGTCNCAKMADGSAATGPAMGGSACQFEQHCLGFGVAGVGECNSSANPGNKCNTSTWTCECAPGYYGAACTQRSPSSCPTADPLQECSGNGVCDSSSATCYCKPGYLGWDCSLACKQNPTTSDFCSTISPDAYQPQLPSKKADGTVVPGCTGNTGVCPNTAISSKASVAHGTCELNMETGQPQCICDMGYGASSADESGGGYCGGCASGFSHDTAGTASQVAAAVGVTHLYGDVHARSMDTKFAASGSGGDAHTADTDWEGVCKPSCPGFFATQVGSQLVAGTCSGQGTCVSGTCQCFDSSLVYQGNNVAWPFGEGNTMPKDATNAKDAGAHVLYCGVACETPILANSSLAVGAAASTAPASGVIMDVKTAESSSGATGTYIPAVPTILGSSSKAAGNWSKAYMNGPKPCPGYLGPNDFNIVDASRGVDAQGKYQGWVNDFLKPNGLPASATDIPSSDIANYLGHFCFGRGSCSYCGECSCDGGTTLPAAAVHSNPFWGSNIDNPTVKHMLSNTTSTGAACQFCPNDTLPFFGEAQTQSGTKYDLGPCMPCIFDSCQSTCDIAQSAASLGEDVVSYAMKQLAAGAALTPLPNNSGLKDYLDAHLPVLNHCNGSQCMATALWIPPLPSKNPPPLLPGGLQSSAVGGIAPFMFCNCGFDYHDNPSGLNPTCDPQKGNCCVAVSTNLMKGKAVYKAGNSGTRIEGTYVSIALEKKPYEIVEGPLGYCGAWGRPGWDDAPQGWTDRMYASVRAGCAFWPSDTKYDDTPYNFSCEAPSSGNAMHCGCSDEAKLKATASVSGSRAFNCLCGTPATTGYDTVDLSDATTGGNPTNGCSQCSQATHLTATGEQLPQIVTFPGQSVAPPEIKNPPKFNLFNNKYPPNGCCAPTVYGTPDDLGCVQLNHLDEPWVYWTDATISSGAGATWNAGSISAAVDGCGGFGIYQSRNGLDCPVVCAHNGGSSTGTCHSPNCNAHQCSRYALCFGDTSCTNFPCDGHSGC